MTAIKSNFSTAINLDKKNTNSNSAYATYMYRDYEGIMEPLTNIMNRLKNQKNNLPCSHFDAHSQDLMTIIMKVIESKESKDIILQQLAALEKRLICISK